MGLKTKLGLKTRRYLKRPFGRGQETERAKTYYEAARKFLEKRIEEGNYTREERQFALSHDMLPNKRGLYDFSKHSPEDYATDVESTIWWAIVKKDPYAVLLENKLITYQLLSPSVATPKIHEVYKEGINVHFGAAVEPSGTDLFARPLFLYKGTGGTRVKFANYQETVQELLKNYSDLIITECVEQHEFMNNLFPATVNTVRILTMRDQETGRARTVCGIVRVGTEISKPVDNFGSGALSFDLDTETGRIGVGLQNKDPWDRLEVHPDSNVRITGQILPGGDKVVRKCQELHALLPFIPVIGWDMAIGVDDFVLIEANLGSGFDALQPHGPLLLDPSLKEFFRSQDIL